MNPLLAILIADGVEPVVRGLVSHLGIRPSRTGAVSVDDLRTLHRALVNKGYKTPSFNLGSYKDFLMGAVRSADVAAQFNSPRPGAGTPTNLPLFPGADPNTVDRSYLVVFTVRYPDGTTADAVVEVESTATLSADQLRAAATANLESRLNITSFPGEKSGMTGRVESYRVVSAYRGSMP